MRTEKEIMQRLEELVTELDIARQQLLQAQLEKDQLELQLEDEEALLLQKEGIRGSNAEARKYYIRALFASDPKIKGLREKLLEFESRVAQRRAIVENLMDEFSSLRNQIRLLQVLALRGERIEETLSDRILEEELRPLEVEAEPAEPDDEDLFPF